MDRRPAEELYAIHDDPGCLRNLAGDPAHDEARRRLAGRLDAYLRETGDPRVLDGGDVWETYPRFSPIRWFPEPAWARADPSSVPPVPWLAERRPGH